MKAGCEEGGVVVVEVVVDVVPVEVRLTVVPDEVANAQIAVGVPLRSSCVPAKTLPIETSSRRSLS